MSELKFMVENWHWYKIGEKALRREDIWVSDRAGKSRRDARERQKEEPFREVSFAQRGYEFLLFIILWSDPIALVFLWVSYP